MVFGGACKLLILWSGRRDSNPRRPAWEVTRHFNFRHLESAGVGLESTETPGKTAVHRERLLMECNWSAARAHRQLPETALRYSRPQTIFRPNLVTCDTFSGDLMA